MALDQFAHVEAHFDKNGQSIGADPASALQAILELPENRSITDLLVLSHGWNNNAEQAREFYNPLLHSLSAVAPMERLSDSLAVVALYWPSKQFDFERRRRGGGAAGVSAGGRSADHATVIAALDDLRELTETDAQQNSIEVASAMVPDLDDLRSARDAFVASLLPLLSDQVNGDAGDGPEPLLTQLTGREVLDKLDRPLPPAPAGATHDDVSAGSVVGGAAGGVAAGAQRGALSFINLLTFWKMKARAGTVGRRGVAPLLDRIARSQGNQRLHLAGHSFGARLLTAAAMAVSEQTALASLSLLQGAFSHHGFAENLTGNPEHPRRGAFRKVVEARKVQGPIIITHTRNDRAVGLAYPIAARLSRDDAAALGDADSRFGGMGSNGAVRTNEAKFLQLGPDGTRYAFQSNPVYNLQADAFVSNHSDVTGPEVATALLAAMQTFESNP